MVDDEPGCIRNLQHYLAACCPRISVTGTAGNMGQLQQLLEQHPVDLLFLDIHLFDCNVFDLLPQQWLKQVAVVFVTAYGQYALDAFRVSALDYLLKPLETAEVQRCYEKIIRHFDGAGNSPEKEEPQPGKGRKIQLRQGDHIFFTSTANIIVLKAQGFYTHVYFEHEGMVKTIVFSKPINLVFKEWEDAGLMRVHRSYAVNLAKISAVRKTTAGLVLQLGDIAVPVAKSRNTEFLSRYHV